MSQTMASQASAPADGVVGMMDGAYFTSRKDVLDFINSQLGLQLTKIEQTASGAVACQLTEYMFPGSINLSRVNWEAKSEYEFVNNYKLLQEAFNKNKVQRFVDVTKLVRAKYQDNLEFMQWFKAFFDQCAVAREGYDPAEARSKGKGGKDVKKHLDRAAKEAGSKLLPTDRHKQQSDAAAADAPPAPLPRPALRDASNAPRGDERAAPPPSKHAAAPAASKREVAKAAQLPPPALGDAAADGRAQASHSRKGAQPQQGERPAGKKDLKGSQNVGAPQQQAAGSAAAAELLAQNAALRTTVEGLEKERDFYFDKLRDVEIVLQAFQEKVEAKERTLEKGGNKLIEDIFKLLYATTDDKVKVGDDGEIIGA